MPPKASRRVMNELATNLPYPPRRAKAAEGSIAFFDAKKRGLDDVRLTDEGSAVNNENQHRTIEDCDPDFVRQEAETAIYKDVPANRRPEVLQAVLGISTASDGPKTGDKRAHTEDSGHDSGNESSDGELDNMVIDKNCDQVRRLVNRFIDNGGMKIGEFCSAINVSNKSYNNFMRQSGPSKGIQSDAYLNSWAFFKKRELKGVPMPKATNKKQKKDDDDPKEPTSKDSKKGSSKGGDAPTAAELADMHLDGEENDAVEVYDTCDEIRKKINAHLRKPGVTQAQFCRDLVAMYHTPGKKPARIQSQQLGAFRGKKGPDAGNTSCVFYAAYCFFEKLRLKEKKPKSKHREEMERVWGREGGFDVEKAKHNQHFWGTSDERIWKDQYGKVHIH